MKYKVGSLFAGVGGICLGFKNAGFKDLGYEIVWANEIDELAAYTYKMNFEHDLIVGDIEKIVKPEREEDENLRKEYELKRAFVLKNNIDVLVGGFPCQAFSIAGERKGFDDHRGNLFWSIADLIRLLEDAERKPKVLFLENVKNLKSHDNGNTYKVIKTELEKLEYIVKEAVLNTKDFSRLPQNRERIFIVGFLDKKAADRFTMFDSSEHLKQYMLRRSSEDRIKDIENVLNLNATFEQLAEYYYTKNKYPHYFLTEQDYLAIPETDRKNERINLEEQITQKYEFYQVRRGMYVRKNQNGVCPTLTANMGSGGHNVPLIKVDDGIRKLTPEETFKLQGFPVENGYQLPQTIETNGIVKKFPKSRLYHQAGNAVSVDIIKLIASEILKALAE